MITIVFMNDCDKYTKESFIEVHDFFSEHDIPFADSFFISNPNSIDFLENKGLIKQYYLKGEIDTLHGLPTLEREEIRKLLIKLKANEIRVKIFTNHGRMTENYKI